MCGNVRWAIRDIYFFIHLFIFFLTFSPRNKCFLRGKKVFAPRRKLYSMEICFPPQKKVFTPRRKLFSVEICFPPRKKVFTQRRKLFSAEICFPPRRKVFTPRRKLFSTEICFPEKGCTAAAPPILASIYMTYFHRKKSKSLKAKVNGAK